MFVIILRADRRHQRGADRRRAALPRAARARAGPVRRRPRRPAAGCSPGSRCSRWPCSSTAIVRTDDARADRAGGAGRARRPRRRRRSGSRACRRCRSPRSTESATGEEPISGQEPTQTSPLQIDAIAQQWLWRFEYPGGTPGHRTFTYGELVVPVDTPVVLNITSTDVLHSWWVPALGGQVQATPGDTSQTWFKADEVGRYAGSSTIFSGTSFPAMRAWVRVVTRARVQGLRRAAAEGPHRGAGDIVRGRSRRPDDVGARRRGGE